ncbi:daunorubicin/doxorubicin resistance ATP-binding protein DrrA [Lachnospiraceae bacterium]|nr:daunorubicin/doxorubicin resistance ATP-binding protein DrrA [Lachnospiraceae bacterium]
MEIIKVNDLTKRYGDFTAVDHVSFSVERGTMLAYLGVNGAGKTTVINMLATLLTPDGGEAKVCGKSLGKENEEIRRKIGIVYQQNCLDDILTVRENLMCRGMIHGATRAEAKEQCTRLGKILKLEEIMKKRVQMLSGGQKRKCEIAAALMHTPEILFLDEPTTGLDPATRADVWETIESLRKMEGMTVFLTTHYMEEAAGAEQIIIMDHGNILASGTPFALKEKFASDKLKLYCKEGKERQIMEMKDFLSSGNDVKGKLKLVDDHIIEAEIPATLQALPLIRQAEGMIEGFEVIQGSMDDMFLNAVGKELA